MFLFYICTCLWPLPKDGHITYLLNNLQNHHLGKFFRAQTMHFESLHY